MQLSCSLRNQTLEFSLEFFSLGDVWAGPCHANEFAPGGEAWFSMRINPTPRPIAPTDSCLDPECPVFPDRHEESLNVFVSVLRMQQGNTGHSGSKHESV